MNITDIDDKIIRRARQNHLFDEYVLETKSLEEIIEDAKKVMELFENNAKNTTDPDKKIMLTRMLTK